ncbi:transglutaminase-like domain-containing protein [Lacunisphaera limnophila]|uniref:transglutaminase-like domain-containing protein n=1 Tax=Lacunisphaera limnophila TaxID=1838286 RepID=UPI00147210DC|nr:transglutaminase-like domain-containing protein [Lacunisphaera limnophila]
MSPTSSISSRPARAALWLLLLASGVAAPADLDAVTLRELAENPGLNPKKFASHFGDFAYEFNGPIQPPNTFLARERGDCDDYAVLADHVLKKRGYVTRLIHIRLAGRVAHAVCYVNENKAYLDYNNRSVFFTLTRSGAELREIAAKVAASLEANWTTASEFSYSYATRRKTMIATVSLTGGEPVPGTPRSSAFDVD